MPQITPKPDPQFKLFASTFPVWWTHNSIDKPDPTYFEHLNDIENVDGFQWKEVDFTFNFKNQFEGTIIVDNQYYTTFKLYDSKDSKFPNKYYLVESVNKAFNGGYELVLRLDVFTTYGLDFWVNGVTNPDINTKTVNLNRTNHSLLLLRYFYNYIGISAGQDFGVWNYKDPLLDFKNMPTISAVASYMGIDSENPNKYVLPPIPVDRLFKVNLADDGKINNNGVAKGATSIVVNGRNIDNPGGSQYLTSLFSGTVRYYVFKNFPINGLSANIPGTHPASSQALNPVYTMIYTVAPNLNSDLSLPWLAENPPAMDTYRYKLLSIHERGTSLGFERNIVSAPDPLLWMMDNSGVLSSNFVGIFEGPPLWAFSRHSYFLGPNGAVNYMLSHGILEFTNKDLSFLYASFQITPSALGRDIYAPKHETTIKTPNYFTIFSLSKSGDAPNIFDTSTQNILQADTKIEFNNGDGYTAYNNAYVFQKSQVQDLNFQPFKPSTIFSSFNVDWEDDLKNKGWSLPHRVLAKLDIPNSIFFNSQGFRFGYLNNLLNMDLTLWLLPGAEASATDLYSSYITSALINQNTSMAIAKQQAQLGVAKSIIGGVLGVAGGAISGGAGGILGGISSIANMATGIAGTIMNYKNQQKTYDAQNSANRAVMGYSINASTDKDSASNLVANNLFQYNNSWWGYIALTCFNWMIPIRIPTLLNDTIYYNNLVYLNGFYLNCSVPISGLALDWSNRSQESPGIMPHLYYDFDITPDVLKYHYKYLNLELLQTITILFNNGIRFWAGFPDFSKPWYWITGGPQPTGSSVYSTSATEPPKKDPPPPPKSPVEGWGGGGYTGGGMFR